MVYKNRSNIYYAFPFLAVMVLAIAGYSAQAERYPNVPDVNDRNGIRRWNNSANISSYNQRGNRQDRGDLNGTWQLDDSRSDNVASAVNRATRNLPPDDRQRLGNMLRRRLRAPETIAIEQRGRHFTIASSRGRQIAFDATGRPRTETSIGGRPVQVNALLNRDQLVISSTGDRGRDYHVTFDANDRGEQLRVTRRIYVDRLSQPVIVSSIYDRASDVAQLDLYRGGWNYPGPNERSDNYFIVPHNTRLVGVLNQELDTETAREGDHVSLVIRSPREYENTVVEGITDVERSGRVSGHAEMSFDFDRIRTPNGRTYPFAGYVESIRAPGGDDIRIDNEGSIREEDGQTRRTATRTGIGGAVGALIGAIAGGGKGAAIGAAAGAGTGAGSVFVQGRDDLELKSGTEITIRTVRPRDAEARR